MADLLLDGKYRLIRALGEGSGGVVWVAEHTFLKKHFAVKILRPGLTASAELAERFEQEARAASAVDHANIVQVTDFGRAATGEHYLVMELLEGRTLGDLLDEGPLAAGHAVELTIAILAGLEAAHRKGVLHRDLKPDNVFIQSKRDFTEAVKILDFGLAKLRASDRAPTAPGTVLGTPRYMAPEQVHGTEIDHTADLHAAGVMLYEMLSGHTPYEAADVPAMLVEIGGGTPTPITTHQPACDRGLVAIVDQAIARERSDRFASARAFREALDAWRTAKELITTKVEPVHPIIPPRAVPPPLPPRLELIGVDGSALPAPRGRKPDPPPQRPVSERFVAPPAALDSNRVSELEIDHERVAQADHAAAAVQRPLPEHAPIAVRPLPRESGAKWLLLIPLGAALAIGGLLLWRRMAPAVAPQVNARTPAGDAGQPAPRPTSGQVEVVLVDLPKHATVYVDGVRTPHPLILPWSKKTVFLRVECPGYRTLVRTFVTAETLRLDGRMERGAP